MRSIAAGNLAPRIAKRFVQSIFLFRAIKLKFGDLGDGFAAAE